MSPAMDPPSPRPRGRAAARPLLAAAVLFGALSGCILVVEPPEDRVCSPDDCAGCCLSGLCQPGNTGAACGTDGLGCVRCLSDEVCEAGRCRRPAEGCRPGNCAGCCRGGVCEPGVLAAACGAGGVACATCGDGLGCEEGECVETTAPCGPTTCAGCCLLGECETGRDVDACGSGGGSCTGCTDGDVCRSGECRPPGPGCSPLTCNGCCLEGLCEPGIFPDACGRFGASCLSCGDGLTCRAGGCAAPGALGDACAEPEECAGLACASAAPGGGYCLEPCDPEACSDDGVCVLLGATAADAYCMRGCEDDLGCRTEHYCVELMNGKGACFPRCSASSHCSSGVCNRSTGKCEEWGVIGDACAADGECGEDYVCAKDAPGGYCTRSCDHSRTCPDGSGCVALGATSLCLDACGPGDSCRAQYLCSEGFCRPRCAADGDCPLGARCDSGSGECVTASPAGGEVGASCTAPEACDEGACFASFPGGYCTAECSEAAPACPGDSVCLAPELPWCWDLCANHFECREGYVCYGASEEYLGICFPSCAVLDYCDAESGDACDPASGTCVKQGGGPGVSVERSVLAPVSLPANQYSANVAVTVPEDALGLTVAMNAGPADSFFLVRVLEPSGRKIYDVQDFGGSVLRPYAMANAGSQVTLLPNTPLLNLTPGAYLFSWAGNGAVVTATPTVLVKRSANALLSAGTLDLNFVFVGHPTLTATTAQASPQFQAMVAAFADLAASAGIAVGEVDYSDLGGDDATRYALLNDDQLGSLMRTSASLADGRLTVYWVRAIRSGGMSGGIVLGMSAGIPGSPLRGTGSAGVAMSLGDFPGAGWAPQNLAQTLFHEMGHWLGLFHVTERDGLSFDVLPDTAECPRAARDANADGVLTGAECLEHGGRNFMFWSKDHGLDQSQISPNQKFVMLRHAAVR